MILKPYHLHLIFLCRIRHVLFICPHIPQCPPIAKQIQKDVCNETNLNFSIIVLKRFCCVARSSMKPLSDETLLVTHN